MKKLGGFLKGLKGVGIGDGFTAPYEITSEVGNFAHQLGLLDYQERSKVEKVLLNLTNHHQTNSMKELHESFDIAL